MKRKCDGMQPCNRCRRRSRACAYSYKQKSGPPKGSKRKLIAADEDLLENRQARPKLLPLAMWPKDVEEAASRVLDSASLGATGEEIRFRGVESGGRGGANTTSSSAANGINRLLAVGGRDQPRLPGISIPSEVSGNNDLGAFGGHGVVTASSGNAGPSASPPRSAGSRARSKGATRTGGLTVGARKRGSFTRPIADLVLPIGAAQLSLEARAGAYRKAQEAAAAGMAAARAFVEGEFPTDENGEFVVNSR